MHEVKVKTHLIVTDVHEEYFVDWFGSIAEAKPIFKNNMPIFVLISSQTRLELNTIDIHRIEECAKRITRPRGRKSVTTDVTRIFIKEEDGQEKLIGKVIHNHVKQYNQMFDTVQKI